MKVKVESNYGLESFTVTACKNAYGWTSTGYYGIVSKVPAFDDMSEDYEYQTSACGGTTYFNY